jgi:hypothetical protein
MTNYPTIQEQIEAVKRATEKALRPKEASRDFLVRAGILKEHEVKEPPKKKK